MLIATFHASINKSLLHPNRIDLKLLIKNAITLHQSNIRHTIRHHFLLIASR